MLIYIDILSDTDVASDSYKTSDEAKGAVMAIESKRIQIGGDDVGVSANVDEDAAEGAVADGGDSDIKTVINIVHSHQLQPIELSKKEFKSAQKAYWKSLVSKMKEKRDKLIFGSAEIPEDKEERKAAEEEAREALDKYDAAAVKVWDDRISAYKKNFKALEAFVKETIIPDFKEYEFYLPNEGVFGECVIIPARYIGEAEAPIFYFWKNGLIEKKE
jgi:hypothetical protein